MKRKLDPIYRHVVDEIKRLGGTVDDERAANGSHMVVYWSIGERRFHSTMPKYAGNWRSIRNAVAGVRSKARGTGL